jgi:hypothetical protein
MLEQGMAWTVSEVTSERDCPNEYPERLMEVREEMMLVSPGARERERQSEGDQRREKRTCAVCGDGIDPPLIGEENQSGEEDSGQEARAGRDLLLLLTLRAAQQIFE